ncbi:putative membrane protein [Bacteroides fragilis str. 3725 D9(v)]|nr:putative membrane protein [Bacteroides fragilis str. 3725 D9(v)]EYA69027.1 putative membrane protein [Bacteroides fragilis str. S24L15]EYA77700.1 putative membrane protein [Bacteroides fragilis str. S24L26]EYA82017.1 putative membrane protein [Bacteroides fragilis str. S24L34]
MLFEEQRKELPVDFYYLKFLFFLFLFTYFCLFVNTKV